MFSFHDKLALSSVVCFLIVSATPLQADTTYTYQGNPFTQVELPYTSSNFISGFFTTATPLAPNTFTLELPTTGFSFSDGVQTITNATAPGRGISPTFTLGTDSSGNIIAWSVLLVDSNALGILSLSADAENSLDAGVVSEASGLNTGAPGVWSTSSSAVPEPSYTLLLGLALLGGLGRAIRKTGWVRS